MHQTTADKFFLSFFCGRFITRRRIGGHRISFPLMSKQRNIAQRSIAADWSAQLKLRGEDLSFDWAGGLCTTACSRKVAVCEPKTHHYWMLARAREADFAVVSDLYLFVIDFMFLHLRFLASINHALTLPRLDSWHDFLTLSSPQFVSQALRLRIPRLNLLRGPATKATQLQDVHQTNYHPRV